MRVNIYAEELTKNIDLIKKATEGKEFYGIRLYLKSHPDLHHTSTDNDESAITIWIPHKKGRNDFNFVCDLLDEMSRKLEEQFNKEYEEQQKA